MQSEAKKAQREVIYLKYITEHKTIKQLADEFGLHRNSIWLALKSVSKSPFADNKDKIELALNKILMRIQKFQERINSGELTPKQEIGFYELMLKHEKYASELDGLIHTDIEIKDSNVLVSHNVRGIQKMLTSRRKNE